MISHITALSKNRVIGDKGRLPWHLSEDLKFFKEKTLNKCIIMGRKTFDSLGKPLPKRHNIVITRNPDWIVGGVDVFSDVETAIKHAQSLAGTYGEEIMIVGGAEIYKLTLPLADRLYLTEIDQTVSGDAYYPEWKDMFRLVDSRPSQQDGLKFSFNTYEKIK